MTVMATVNMTNGVRYGGGDCGANSGYDGRGDCLKKH